MGTLGTDPPSAGFSCVPGIAADGGAIASSPPGILSVGCRLTGFDVEDGIGGLEVESSDGFTVDDVESALQISILGYTYTLVYKTAINESEQRDYCDIP